MPRRRSGGPSPVAGMERARDGQARTVGAPCTSVMPASSTRRCSTATDWRSVRPSAGPAIVEEWTTTTVIPPGWAATTDRMGNLVMESI